jgi:hypothetical protein
MTTLPLFMARYCLRGRRKRLFNTPKTMPRMSYSLKRNLQIKNHKKTKQNLTKGPNPPMTSSNLHPLTKQNQILNPKNPTNCLSTNTVAANELDLNHE